MVHTEVVTAMDLRRVIKIRDALRKDAKTSSYQKDRKYPVLLEQDAAAAQTEHQNTRNQIQRKNLSAFLQTCVL